MNAVKTSAKRQKTKRMCQTEATELRNMVTEPKKKNAVEGLIAEPMKQKKGSLRPVRTTYPN